MASDHQSGRLAVRGLLFCAAAAFLSAVSCVKNGPEKAVTQVSPTADVAESATPEEEVARMLARRARAERLVAAMNQHDYVAAEQVTREMIESAHSTEEAIRARRTLRSVRMFEGNTEEALQETLAAQACLDADSALRAANPGLAASLLVDRAQTYELIGRLREAAALYDEARQIGELSASDERIAAFNTAVLFVQMGEHAEGVVRVDQYLASDVARGLERNRVISLRCQQVKWLAAGNDLAGAMARADEVLVRYEGVDHPSLASVAVMRARYTPIGPGCAERRERIAAAQGMLSRLDHLDLDQFHATRGELHDMRQQLAVILRDTEAACPE
jgi:tetratricopeptide (TPR) repeat protein